MRSMNVCRELERKHGLIPATDKERNQTDKVFRPVKYKAGDVKSQIASVVRHLPNYYQYQTLGEYNALLSLFNITTEKIEGELQGQLRQGLLYIPLNEQGERAGYPFKASLFGKSAGMTESVTDGMTNGTNARTQSPLIRCLNESRAAIQQGSRQSAIPAGKPDSYPARKTARNQDCTGASLQD